MDETELSKMKRFAMFLQNAFIAYQQKAIDQGRRIPSQTEFAQWVGVAQTSLSNWMNAVRPPNDDNIDLLATKLGPEVYDIFDKPRRVPKDRMAQTVNNNWYKITDSQRRHIVELIENYVEDNESAKNKNSGEISGGSKINAR